MIIIAQLFRYKARDKQGKLIESLIEADNKEVVAKRLRDRGYYVTSINQERDRKEGLGAQFQSLKRVKLSDLALFCRQFATMVSSGLSLVRSLDILVEQTSNPKLRDAISSIKENVESGMPLSRAMKLEKNIFPQLFISMIEAGEAGGLLEETLEEMADHFESQNELSQKVKSALAYPLVIIVVAIAVVIFLVVGILPTFVSMFSGMDQQLPAVTRYLLAFSEFCQRNWYLIPAVIIIPIAAIYFYYQSHEGRRRIDQLLLKAPVFGDLVTKISVARFSSTFGILLESGVSILESLEIVSKVINNKVVADAVKDSIQSISEGESIAIPLRKDQIFPRMVLQMIRIGEETGRLDEMLLKVSEFYEKEVEHKVEAVVSLIEPAMIVFLGVIVGTIVLAMMLPMFNMIQGF